MEALPQTLRVEARRLRGSESLSFRAIALRLDISQSTARRWTLDVPISARQRAKIDSHRAAAALGGSRVMAANCRELRRASQAEGRIKAREGDPLHQAGCVLYWAEGRKSRNTLVLGNSDLNLMRLFRRFLSECLHIRPAQMTLRLHAYTGNGLTIREIEDRWLNALNLPRACLRKHSINRRPAATSGTKRNKLPYGVADLGVLRSTGLIQHIYGAIQEYGGFDEPRWLE
jgi:hypothetical protein